MLRKRDDAAAQVESFGKPSRKNNIGLGQI